MYANRRSQVLAVIQSSIVLRACSDGLGKSADLIAPATLVHVQKVWTTMRPRCDCVVDLRGQLYYTSNIFFILALGLSKLSVVFFLIRITAVKEQRLVFHVVAGLIAAWTLASTFVVALQCNLGHPWIIVGQNCSGAVSVPGAFQSSTSHGWLMLLCLIVPTLESPQRFRYHLRSSNRSVGHLPCLGPTDLSVEEDDCGERIRLPSCVSILSGRTIGVWWKWNDANHVPASSLP